MHQLLSLSKHPGGKCGDVVFVNREPEPKTLMSVPDAVVSLGYGQYIFIRAK